MRRDVRPDGFVSSAAAATLALVAGIEDAGLKLGRDVDVVSKQSSRPAAPVPAGNCWSSTRTSGWPARELARSVLGWIGGATPGSLQSLSKPTGVLAYRRPD